MNLRNKVSFFLLSFVAVPLFAQTPQQELERLQQNYIQSFISNDDRMLLVGPGSRHAVTVAFLIVQGEVLHVSVDAVFLCACDGVCGHSTGQDTVLRVGKQ